MMPAWTTCSRAWATATQKTSSAGCLNAACRTTAIGTELHERTDTRTNQRNGVGATTLSRPAGDNELRLRKLRVGSLFPTLLEPRRRRRTQRCRGRSPSPAAQPSGLHGQVVTTGVGGDHDTTMMQLHRAAVADDLHGLTGQPHPALVTHRRETDRALAVDFAGRRDRHRRFMVIDRLRQDRLGRDGVSEPEPLPRRHHPDALVRPVMVVVLDPRIQPGLRVSDVAEHSAGERGRCTATTS